MEPENKQKNQKIDESSPTESGDLMITPHGETAKGEEEVQSEAAQPAPEQVAEQPVVQEESKKVGPIMLDQEKPVKKKKDLFDLRLKKLKKKKLRKKHEVEEEVVKPVARHEMRYHHFFTFRKPKEWSTFAMVAKNVAFAVIAFVFFAGTIAFDNVLFAAEDEVTVQNTILSIPEKESVSIMKDGEKRLVSDSFLLSGGEQVMTNDSELIEVMLVGQGVLRLGENTTLTFEEIDNVSKEYKIKLQGGTIWGNTRFDDFDLEIYTETALVDQ
jgi:hypothetical protein